MQLALGSVPHLPGTALVSLNTVSTWRTYCHQNLIQEKERKHAGAKGERIIGKLWANDRIALQSRPLIPKPGTSRRLLLLCNTEFQRDVTKILYNVICPPTLPRDFLSGRKGVHCVLVGFLLHPKATWREKGWFQLTLAVHEGESHRKARQEPRNMNWGRAHGNFTT